MSYILKVFARQSQKKFGATNAFEVYLRRISHSRVENFLTYISNSSIWGHFDVGIVHAMRRA